ncbi:MAG: hypothetical protein WDZ90_00600 [Candidatus Paceibacterota bacterium]
MHLPDFDIEEIPTVAAFALMLALSAGLVFLIPSPTSPVAEVPLEAEGKSLHVEGLKAEAVYVLDVATGEVLFEKNANLQLPLASITKLMTALVASKYFKDSDRVVISSEALATEGDSGFREGESWSFSDLLDFTLITSSNDGATAIAGAAFAGQFRNFSLQQDSFVQSMNRTAEDLGLSQTYFLNPTGLDESEAQSGAYGSAKDIGLLTAHILRTQPEIIEETRRERAFLSSQNELYEGENTNASVGAIPGLIGSKTGFTDLAGGNLVVAFDVGLNHPIVAVILHSGKEERFTDAEILSFAVFSYFQENKK